MKATLKKLVLSICLVGTSSVSFAYGEAPAGWTLITGASTSNVKFYKKNNAEVYAQVVNMGTGAKVELRQIQQGTMTNQWGTFNTYKRDSINNWYNNVGSPVSVVNGDFFDQNLSPTPISFAIRANNTFVEKGGNPNNKRQIEFFTGQGAMVIAADQWRISNGPSQNAMGGHAPEDTPTPNANRGRTSLCTLFPKTPSPLFLILVHLSAMKNQVDGDLANWKCNYGSEIVMDGSASSQLAYKESGTTKIKYGTADGTLPASGRAVPQVIVIRNN